MTQAGTATPGSRPGQHGGAAGTESFPSLPFPPPRNEQRWVRKSQQEKPLCGQTDGQTHGQTDRHPRGAGTGLLLRVRASPSLLRAFPGSSEVAEDADVGELGAVPVRVEAQQQRPLESHEAPHARQVVALGVSQGWGEKKNQKTGIR